MVVFLSGDRHDRRSWRGISGVRIRATLCARRESASLAASAPSSHELPSSSGEKRRVRAPYGCGKPTDTVAPEGYDPLELDEVTREAAAIVDELALKRSANPDWT